MGPALLLAILTSAPEHLRLETSRGPVHVLIPGRASVTVVYVHGYGTRVDAAWEEHRLEKQFLDSGLEAAFIVPEAPSGPGEDVSWPDLEALLGEVERAIAQKLPSDVLAAGHSGAYRTLSLWAASPRVRAFVLLDAFYSSPAVWDLWLKRDPDHRLFVLAHSTAQKSNGFCARHRTRTQLSCANTRVGHMQIVTNGEALPALLGQASAAVALLDS